MAAPGPRRGLHPAGSGRYLRHPELGADLLELAGSDPLTVAWAREHHLPAERVDRRRPTSADALKAADDD